MAAEDNHGPLTDADRTAIATSAREIQAAEGISDVTMARILGCSGPLYSQLKVLKYRGNADKWLRRLRRWMTDRSERADLIDVEYVHTTIGQSVLTVCRRAWSKSRIGRIVTPSGCGKTAALREFARRGGSRVLYVQVGEACSAKLTLIREIARQLGMSHDRSASFGVLAPLVREVLAGYYAEGRGTPICLLVDEATTLRPAAINMLRNLSDDAQVRLALVLADTWRLDAELSGRTGRGWRTREMLGGYEQLNSRIAADYRLAVDAEIREPDVRAVADAVMASLPEISRRRALPARSYTYLHQLAQADGKLRNVVNRIEAVADVAEAASARPTWSVAELDYVAPLVGHACRMAHTDTPFTAQDGPPAARRAS
ncbi:MAG TPA: ATP-binding protein [Phycisphaerae bacterium]|nr:ATP-binding protein [Phycisphaerae bacterium]